MSRRLKFLLILPLVTVLVLAALAGAGWLCLRNYTHPTWTERYAVAGDRLCVEDGARAPLPGVLVLRVAATGGLSGGWDRSFSYPKPGEQPWFSLDRATRLDITSAFTGADGAAPVPPFTLRCHGERRVLGSGTTHGGLFVIAYSRGRGCGIIRPRLDIPEPSPLPMPPFVSYNADPKAEAEWARYRAIQRLALPFSFMDDVNRVATARLWAHVLPDGRTVAAFAADEADALAREAKSQFVPAKSAELRDALRAGDPRAIKDY